MEIQPRYRYKIHDKLYDLTEFINIHPGGRDMFNMLKADTDITPMIYSYHKNPKRILERLPKYEVPMPESIHIKYETNYSYDTYCELKQLVYDEIREKQIPLHWTNVEIAYNVLLMSLYIGVWIYCFINAKDLSYWWMVLLALMNIGFIALIFHETSHYCGFKNQKINSIITNLIMSPIITTEDWHYDHNYLHHCFTNTEYDEDYTQNQKLFHDSKNHESGFNDVLQFLYAITMFIIGGFDKGPLRAAQNKRWNILLFLGILYTFGFIRTFIMYGITGFLFLSLAQLSHIQHECIHLDTDKKNDFLYRQVLSSVNYKTDNPLIRLICFSLDIQTEHHLFPNLPHSSIRKISHVVREYCDKNGIRYIEKPDIFSAIYSYIQYIYNYQM